MWLVTAWDSWTRTAGGCRSFSMGASKEGRAGSSFFHCTVSLISASLNQRPHGEAEQISLEGWGIKGNYTREESPVLLCLRFCFPSSRGKDPDRNLIPNQGHTLIFTQFSGLQIYQKHTFWHCPCGYVALSIVWICQDFKFELPLGHR